MGNNLVPSPLVERLPVKVSDIEAVRAYHHECSQHNPMGGGCQIHGSKIAFSHCVNEPWERWPCPSERIVSQLLYLLQERG